MLKEGKILVDNIKHFRHLLTEGVSDSVLVDAINEHKYLYIYYEGDDTIETGYRTIRPFVLGLINSKKHGQRLALRAWQDKGRSDSLRPDAPRAPRFNHEKTVDNDSKTKPGWRLFIVDNIKSAYPTGVKFVDKQGNVMIPPLYNKHDKDMSSIVAAVSQHPEKQIGAMSGTTGATGTSTQKVSKWEKFKAGNPKNRKMTKNDVMGLADIAKRVMKKPIDRFFIAIDDQNYYYLQDKNIKPKFPQNAIVGDMDVLYRKFVKPTPSDQQKKKFYDQELNDLKQNTGQPNQDQTIVKENEKFPVNIKTFFKQ